MKFKVALFLIIVCFSGLLVGCQQHNKDPKAIETKSSLEGSIQHVVKAVKIHDAPNHVSSPAEAIIHQYEVMFKNGDSEYPKADSIISEALLGKTSILTIHSPEGKNNYAIFLYHYKDNWIMDSMLRIVAFNKNAYKDKKGLDLPMEQFNVIHEKKNGAEIWGFVDKTHIITISKFNRFSFKAKNDTKEISLINGTKAYISTDSFKNPYLYYFDSGKLILISGILSKQEVINLTNSLPSVNAPHFPSSYKVTETSKS